MAEVETPLDEAMGMKKKGLNKRDIAEDLKNKGYNPGQVYDAMNQLDIKDSIGSDPRMQLSVLNQDIPVPEPPGEEELEQEPRQVYQKPIQAARYPSYHPENDELIESMVEEKWQQITDIVGDIELWKSRVNDDMVAITQEIMRLSSRLDNVQRSVLGKVTEYSQSIGNVETDIKALEKVMKNILQPLTSNIKELSRITNDLKKGKS